MEKNSVYSDEVNNNLHLSEYNLMEDIRRKMKNKEIPLFIKNSTLEVFKFVSQK
jgi:hypothetical protein